MQPHVHFSTVHNRQDKWACVCSAVSDSLWHKKPPRLYSPWNFPGINTGVSCHFLLKIRQRGNLNIQWQRNGYTHFPPHFCVILVTCNSSDSNKTPGVKKPGIKSGSWGFHSVNKRFLLLVSNIPVINQRMFFGAFHNTSILLTETHLIHVWLQNLIGSRPGRICCFLLLD